MRTPRHATDIDAAWVNIHLASLLAEPAASVACARIGAGFGLAGVTYRAVIRGATRTETLALKVCNLDSARHEAWAYEHVLPRTTVPAPRFVALLEGDKEGVVVTSFVAGEQGDVLAGCTQAQSIALAQILADLHAPWWGIEDRALPTSFHFKPSRPDPVADDVVARCIHRHEAWIAGGGAALPLHLGDPVANGACLRAQPMTLAHCDFHLDNILFTDEQPVVLDWEGARRAPASYDVARLIVECHPAAQRHERDAMVRRAYLDRLREHAITLDSGVLDAGISASIQVLLAGAVRWAGAEQAVAAGSREEGLQRNLLRNLTASPGGSLPA